MDTSETYIKMCEKAVEIQKQRLIGFDWQEGDWYHWWSDVNDSVKYNDDQVLSENFSYEWCEEEKREVNNIWLPRQDQLQEMVAMDTCSYISFPVLLLSSLGEFTNRGLAPDEGWNDYALSFTSMEQLWLAFVMKEKYNKTWNGEDWVCLGRV